jgi:hypothetical protein
MPQKIKNITATLLLAMIFVNITNAHNKIFDNVGIYYNPMHLSYFPSFSGKNEKLVHGYIVGVNSNIKLSEIFILHTGIGYGTCTYFLNYFDMANWSGFFSHNIRLDNTIKYNMFKSPNKKHILQINTGISISNHLYENSIGFSQNMPIGFYNSGTIFRLYSVTGVAGIGYVFKINDNYSINFDLNAGIPVWKNDTSVLPDWDMMTATRTYIYKGFVIGFNYCLK